MRTLRPASPNRTAPFRQSFIGALLFSGGNRPSAQPDKAKDEEEDDDTESSSEEETDSDEEEEKAKKKGV